MVRNRETSPSTAQPPPPAAITNRPSHSNAHHRLHSNVWMDKPSPKAGCPPGLEYLQPLDQLMVYRNADGGFCRCLASYTVSNLEFKRVYKISELYGDCLMDVCCCNTNKRRLDFLVLDCDNDQMMRFVAPWPCAFKLLSDMVCCKQRMDINLPIDQQRIAQIREQCRWSHKLLTVWNAEDHLMFRIPVPWYKRWAYLTPFSVTITIENTQKKPIGTIWRKNSLFGILRGSRYHYLMVSFPGELEVTMKAALLALTIFVDMKVFQPLIFSNFCFCI